MKKQTIFIGLIFAFSAFLAISSVNAEHMDEEAFFNMQCKEPTESHAVQVVSGETKFNVTSLTLSKDACVKITFINPDDEEHDLTVEYEGEEWIHMDAINGSTDHFGPFGNTTCTECSFPEDPTYTNLTTAEEQGQGMAVHYWKTPNVDVTLEAFCEVTGHRDEGMHFDVIIGEGTPESSDGGSGAPGFELPLVFLGLFSLVFVAKSKRR